MAGFRVLEYMGNGEYFEGRRPVNLEEVLAGRDRRARRQGELLSQYRDLPGKDLSLLGFNIPGEYKRFPMRRATGTNTHRGDPLFPGDPQRRLRKALSGMFSIFLHLLESYPG
jgi:hypothetical protein